jgi:hypothetical protein
MYYPWWELTQKWWELVMRGCPVFVFAPVIQIAPVLAPNTQFAPVTRWERDFAPITDTVTGSVVDEGVENDKIRRRGKPDGRGRRRSVHR